MFSRFLKQKSSKTLSVEIMGVIAGTRSLGDPEKRRGSDPNRAADKLLRQIDTTLEREGYTTEPDIKRFLEMSKYGLRSLASIPSSIGEDIRLKNPEHGTDPLVRLRRANPEWLRKLQAFQGSMKPEAEAVFERHFSREADQRIRDARMQALDDLSRKEPKVELQIKLNG
ncbi:MAG: hypothetical protein CL558_14410 [Alphaproteobacteria bacterium]|nr:hypothetical protein [Alphaproteobacteria bacterium]MAS48540.1 hypothetical protein [Alphaproteobacteria bacterium]MAX96202.1 hypothetical protein [Alphaproteobacteria bacterium]MBN54758.1 hypothetical protein [Alphaproteobacteria bacterium]OUT39193.1 MAG: hypothetical protein CBB62_12350 [Micavibrio sp. TMED2]|tara:strand:- start:510 stop:1019 length:510 start_codon:yes stop_codon:yes gene_type:complete